MNKEIQIICEIGKSFVISKEEEPLEILLNRAKVLVEEAVKSGAKIVKFQCHFYEDEVQPDTKIKSPHFDQDRYEWVKRNTYPVSFWMELKQYCDELGVEFLCTPMSKGSAILLDNIGVNRWKIGSGDILDFVMLDYIRRTGKPVIISSGMSTLQELKLVYDFLSEKVEDITILHCCSQYPCPPENLNLLTIPFLKKHFPRARIGLSSHCLDIRGALVARDLGAMIYEYHMTLNRDLWGSDHRVSLLPDEFKTLVNCLKSDKIEIV